MASDGGRSTSASPPQDVIAGRYRITGRLGRGGMGTVWRAQDELLRRPVAVKELHLPDIGLTERESSPQTERALREARSVARIRHPHVIVVYDVQEHDGRPWIVMELIDGRSLADILAEDGPLDPREAARIGAAVAGALSAAHDREVQHRDVKPANVLIEEATGRVVLTDFGIARIAGSSTLSETGSFVGSPEYTAPERMSGGAAGPASDLWSLGALLCAAVDGESPFHRDSIGEVVHAVAFGAIEPPDAAGPLLPVVNGLLDRDPGRRMAAVEVETLLTAYAETGDPPPAVEVPTVPTDLLLPPTPREAPAASRRARRSVAPAVGAALLAVVAGVVAAVLVVNHDGDSRGGAAAPTTAVTSTRPPSTPATPTGTVPALPAGYERIADPAGFTVDLPAGYTRSPQPPRVYYYSPGREFRFGVRHQAPDPRGPYAVMHDQDVAGPTPHGYKGYRDGVITRTTQHGQPAALWEFTWDGDGGGARRTFDLCWTQDGKMYDIWLSAPVAKIEQSRHDFDTARDSFQAG